MAKDSRPSGPKSDALQPLSHHVSHSRFCPFYHCRLSAHVCCFNPTYTLTLSSQATSYNPTIFHHIDIDHVGTQSSSAANKLCRVDEI